MNYLLWLLFFLCFLVLYQVIDFQLSPNEMSILLLGLLDPPLSFTHYFSDKSRIVAFSDIKSVGLVGSTEEEASIKADFPEKIPVVKHFD